MGSDMGGREMSAATPLAGIHGIPAGALNQQGLAGRVSRQSQTKVRLGGGGDEHGGGRAASHCQMAHLRGHLTVASRDCRCACCCCCLCLCLALGRRSWVASVVRQDGSGGNGQVAGFPRWLGIASA